MTRQLSIFVFVVITVVFHVSGLSEFVLFRDGILLQVVALMVFLLTLRLREFLSWTIVLGICLDLYSGIAFGTITLSLICSGLIGYYLYLNYFSHQANITLVALVAIMTISYGFFFSLFSMGLYAANTSDTYAPLDTPFLLSILKRSLLTSLGFTTIYLLFNRTIERFRDQFIIRRS